MVGLLEAGLGVEAVALQDEVLALLVVVGHHDELGVQELVLDVLHEVLVGLLQLHGGHLAADALVERLRLDVLLLDEAELVAEAAVQRQPARVHLPVHRQEQREVQRAADLVDVVARAPLLLHVLQLQDLRLQDVLLLLQLLALDRQLVVRVAAEREDDLLLSEHERLALEAENPQREVVRQLVHLARLVAVLVVQQPQLPALVQAPRVQVPLVRDAARVVRPAAHVDYLFVL